MQNYASLLKNTFLFKGIKENDITALLADISIEECEYQRGELIYSPDEFEHKLGIVIDGECLVGRQSSGSFVPLNTIGKYGSFGILAVFSVRDEFPTLVKAKGACSICFFSADSVRTLIKRNPTVAMNIIEFFAKKVGFLNDKIASFSGSSIEEKLAGYIIELQRKNASLIFDFNKKKSAESLNCGRASLYRAISSLESGGYISFESKKIIINDLKGLERILK